MLIDGVEGSLDMLNPNDIESVSVLKDAASAAIYGASVGSAGVVLITTKKAESGKLRVSANVSYGLEQVSKLPEMLTAQQYCDVWAKVAENNPGTTIPTLADPTQYEWANITHTDWLDEIFRMGSKQHDALSVSGGG